MAHTTSASTSARAGVSGLAGRLAIAAAAAALLALAALHVLSPEFDPSWRAVSEYANGKHGAVLSLMFAGWAVSSWAAAFALWPHVRTIVGRLGVLFLVTSGAGEAMASVFDIRHPLHGVAALVGIPTLPIAALLVSLSLTRTEAWRPARGPLLWTANLTWISLVLMATSLWLLVATLRQAGVHFAADTAVARLPDGVIGVVGWANRALIAAYCAWNITAAWWSIQLPKRSG